jgi:hypothetical protein
MLGGARLTMAIEEHGDGKQLARFRIRPHFTRDGLLLVALIAGVAALAGASDAWAACAVLAAVGVALAARALVEVSMSTAALLHGIHLQLDRDGEDLERDLWLRLPGDRAVRDG